MRSSNGSKVVNGAPANSNVVNGKVSEETRSSEETRTIDQMLLGTFGPGKFRW